MSVGLNVWSQTASNNSTSDTNINWAEGMAPSQVNDSARAMMASLAKWRDDNNGTISTTGSTAAYTATSNQVQAALTDGFTTTVKFHATNDSSATLNVDGTGAKNLQVVAGTNVSSGVFLSGAIHKFKYDSGSTAWVSQGGNLIDGSAVDTFQIANNAVTFAKLQAPAASRLLGNPSTSTSTTYQTISLGTNLSFSGTTLNAGNNNPVITVITSTATVTWQSTTQNGNFPLYLLVRMVGGGGGGSGAGGGPSGGGDGTNSIFNNWTAVHGTGGSTGSGKVSGGTGGTDGTGTKIRRIPGGDGARAADNGRGGASAVGPGAAIADGNNNAGVNGAANTGAGGSGGISSSSSNGGGSAGEYVEFIVTSPSTAYTVQCGAGGASGTGTQAGGTGGSGRIEVIAHWQ